MFSITVYCAHAETIELARGESRNGTIALYDVYNFSVATVNGPFFMITDQEITGTDQIISYVVTVPQNTPINVYDVIITYGDVSYNVTVVVQPNWWISIKEFFMDSLIGKLLLIIFIIAGVVFLIAQYRKFLKKKLVGKGLIVIVLLFTLVMSVFLIITQSSLVYKHAGDSFNKKILLGEGVGSARVIRSTTTPSVADWISFKNTNDSYMFFTSDGYDKLFYIVNVPTIIDKGVYEYIIRINYVNGDETEYAESFRVI